MKQAAKRPLKKMIALIAGFGLLILLIVILIIRHYRNTPAKVIHYSTDTRPITEQMQGIYGISFQLVNYDEKNAYWTLLAET